MQAKLALIAFALSVPATSFATTYECQGTDGVRGKIEIKIAGDYASATGEFNWDAQSGADTATRTVKCGSGPMDNAGKAGAKTHDYYNLKCEYYLRTRKDMTKFESGYVSLVKPGPSDHDSSGYEYANFFCR